MNTTDQKLAVILFSPQSEMVSCVGIFLANDLVIFNKSDVLVSVRKSV